MNETKDCNTFFLNPFAEALLGNIALTTILDDFVVVMCSVLMKITQQVQLYVQSLLKSLVIVPRNFVHPYQTAILEGSLGNPLALKGAQGGNKERDGGSRERDGGVRKEILE